MADLVKPKVVTVSDLDGVEHSYTISRFPTIASREIITQYPTSGMPKLGDYPTNLDLSRKMFKYIEAHSKTGGPNIRLVTDALIENHVPDGETQLKIEWEAMGYNTSFFGRGKSLNFFTALVENLKERAIKILTDLSEISSRAGKQP